MAQAADCRGPCLAVDHQAGVALVALHGGLRGRAEGQVDAARGVAAAPEQELQRGDVPALDAQRDRACSEPGPAEAPKRAPGLGACDAVDDQAAPPLEAAHARAVRAPDAVNGNRIQPDRFQRRLERGHIRRRRIRWRRRRQDQRACHQRRAGGHPDARHLRTFAPTAGHYNGREGCCSTPGGFMFDADARPPRTASTRGCGGPPACFGMRGGRRERCIRTTTPIARAFARSRSKGAVEDGSRTDKRTLACACSYSDEVPVRGRKE